VLLHFSQDNYFALNEESLMPDVFKILAIDGGGIRGIIPAAILTAIEQKTGKHIAETFDMIAGTSTGGILALALAKPGPDGKPEYRAADLADMYFRDGSTIFPQSIWRKIHTGDYTLDEKYPSDGIETVLQRYFGQTQLKESLVNLLVMSYEIESRMPWLFRSDRAKRNPNFDFPMWQVARATSAAPTYFEPERIDKLNGEGYWALVDGGTYANNPSMCAYAEARRLIPNCDVLIVSLGTGELTRPINYQVAKHWGLIGWAKPVLDVVFDGVSKTTDYQLHQLLPAAGGKRRYYRFQTTLTIASDDMDNVDPENLNDLKTQADALVAARQIDLDDLCAQLC
jgi:patatin-like phospholipase/acyl hydrolase